MSEDEDYGYRDSDHFVDRGCKHTWADSGTPNMRCVHCGERYTDVLWWTRTGSIAIGEMGTEHIVNAVSYIMRKNWRAREHMLPAFEHELDDRIARGENVKIPFNWPPRMQRRFEPYPTDHTEVRHNAKVPLGIALHDDKPGPFVKVRVVEQAVTRGAVVTETEQRGMSGLAANILYNNHHARYVEEMARRGASQGEMLTYLIECVVLVEGRLSDAIAKQAPPSFIISDAAQRQLALDNVKLQTTLKAFEKRCAMLEAERGPGIKAPSEPQVVCDNGWDD